jgi:predicted DNA-binding transcriptional regulator AlpA
MLSSVSPIPRRHHLDRRADDIAESAADKSPDDLLTTVATAEWLGVSHQWLEIGRSKGWGPPFVRLSTRRVRYHRADVLGWLSERTHASTAGYSAAAKRGP